MLDNVERLALTARDCAAVLGNVRTGEFKLIRLGGVITEEDKAYIRERGMAFLALFGKVGEDQLCVEFEPPIDEATAALIIRASLSYAIVPAPPFQKRGDSAEWLRSLWALEDDREKFGPA